MSDQRFCIIPARALEASDLKGMDFKVLCYFGKHADKNGWWRLSQVKMAEYFSCARSTVQLSVTRLIEANLLEKHPVETANGRDSAHYWRVVFDYGLPEVGTPEEVVRSRALAAENEQNSDENTGKIKPEDPCRITGTPADISAPPADPASAPPADPASAPSITTLFNAPPLRSVLAISPKAAVSAEIEVLDQSSFEAFWETFADKRGKLGAQKVWNRKKLDAIAGDILAGARNYVLWRGTDPRFWKQAQGWLNDGRWMDDPPSSAFGGDQSNPRRKVSMGDVLGDAFEKLEEIENG